MSANWHISEENLAKFWRVDSHTIIKWRNAGRLDSDIKGPVSHGYNHFYYIRSVEDFHARHGTGFGPELQLPSFAELRRSDPPLLLPEEAATRLDCDLDSLYRAIRKGAVPALHLGEQSTRLPAALIATLADSQERAVSAAMAAHILCIKPRSIPLLMHDGHLKAVKRIGKGQTKLVERASLLKLLAKLIPSYIPPQVWWEKMLDTEGKPITKGQLIATYHVPRRMVNNLIAQESRSLPCIRTTGSTPQTFIPPWGVQTFLREEWAQPMPQETAN